MHVFVAGGTGYIGSVLVPVLLRNGHRVTVLDPHFFGNTLAQVERRSEGRLRVIAGDTRTFPRSLLAGMDAVVDVSGVSNDASCEFDPEFARSVNVAGGQRLAESAQATGVRRYVYASSCSVYGHTQGTIPTGEGERNPESLYARAKAEVEDFILPLNSAQFEVTALRLATVFGLSPRMRFDLAVNVMTKNAFRERRICVDGGGQQWRPLIHVTDVAEAFAATLAADSKLVAGEMFNVGSSENNVQIRDLALRIRDLIPGTEVVYSKAEPDRRDYRVSFDKIRSTLGYRARFSIEDGIREVLGALESGAIDPEDRRWYTARQYRFLRGGRTDAPVGESLPAATA